MRKLLSRSFLPIFLLLSQSLAAQVTTVKVTDSVLVENVRRLGINVGSRSQWGAAQFLKNLISNPGFEAGVYSSVVLADNGGTASDFRMAFWDPAWNNDQYGVGWPEDFWNGAEYEIVWGNARGRSGHVTDFSHSGGANVFSLDGSGAAPERLSVMLLRRDNVPGLNGNTTAVDATTTRPGSPGRQSLHLENGGYTYRFYMDSMWRDGDRTAGKLLVIEGNYYCSLWAKGASEGDELRVRFFREHEGVFLDERIPLTTQWQRIERRFTVPTGADPVRAYTDQEYHPILGFILEASSSGAQVWVDDVELYSTDNENPTVFTDSFVDRLLELRPGVLRYWGGQLGATLDDQLAEPFARRTNGYSPRTRNAGSWPYSLHEFLELCAHVGADPWYIMPPTFSQSEIEGLVEYLAAPAQEGNPQAMLRAELGRPQPWTQAFERMHIEYGNELWGAASGGDPFMGASVSGGVRLGSIASDRFDLLQAAPHFDGGVMKLVIGGQAGYAGRQQEIVQNSSAHDAVALAPYFGVLDAWSSDADIFGPLLAMPFYEVASGRMRESRGYLDAGAGTEMSIYEVNFHTTHGNAPIDIRNDFLTGMGGGLALPLTMLVYQRDLAARDQCAFSSLQYSFRLESGDMARLWGMLRDVEATRRKRPTWLGVEVVNKAVMGSALRTEQSGDNPTWMQSAVNGIGEEMRVQEVQSFAFAEGPMRGVVLFNLNLETPRRVRLEFDGLPGGAFQYLLSAESIHDDNEDSTTIVIDSALVFEFQSGNEFTLPPHSVTALRWQNAVMSADTPPQPGGYDLWAYAIPGRQLHVRYSIPDESNVRMDVYDVLGRHRARLADQRRAAGTHTLWWNAPSAGTYFIHLVTPEASQVVRVVVFNP